ncbi:DeoR family transcriptional regulator [Nicoletella semolina]|uniref:DeoR family transcriptional regulator n=1 Tax=Nicoletella semolina TaxID=271160 RepID=A0A4R2N7T9_9PAST|nr:HTH-type transcriptional regulator UlaR [Nicoletella semolina]MDH2924637.1 transcriptional regulator [Nicoletella semolina]TCP17002.1 DeoR family transcriptional regulator [Nicoletella semolina]
MNENYRHRRLLNLLRERRILSTADIIQLLDISPATARRDINKLNEQGRLKKVRNGAESMEVAYTQGGHHYDINNAEEKQRIATKAGELCQAGDCVVLTCGSTMQMLGNSLCGKKLQIITNYLPLANYLIEHNHEDIVIMGGQYNHHKKVTLSLNTTESEMPYSANKYAANIMFSSGKGFTQAGLFKTDMIIANSEQQLLAKVEKFVVLLDSTKLGKQVGILFSELKDIDLLITGKEANPKIIAQLREQGLEVILA